VYLFLDRLRLLFLGKEHDSLPTNGSVPEESV